MTIRTESIDIYSPDDALRDIIGKRMPQNASRPKSQAKRPLRRFARDSVGATRNVVCISALERLDERQIARVKAQRLPSGRTSWILLCDRSFPQPEITSRMTALGITSPRRVHVVFDGGNEGEFLRRLIAGIGQDGYSQRILDAYWHERRLVVRSANWDRLSVPIELIPSLRHAAPEDLRDFQIDEDGSFLYWPKLDVHLGWAQLAEAANPALALKAKQESAAFNRKYGAAIRKRREKAGLTQGDIKGLTQRQVGRIERGECRATLKALQKLAAAHGMPANAYMDRLSRGL